MEVQQAREIAEKSVKLHRVKMQLHIFTHDPPKYTFR